MPGTCNQPAVHTGVPRDKRLDRFQHASQSARRGRRVERKVRSLRAVHTGHLLAVTGQRDWQPDGSHAPTCRPGESGTRVFGPFSVPECGTCVVNANLFSMWSIQVRNSGIAVTMTGLLGGVAHFWRKILGFLGSPCRNRELAVIAPNPGHGECSARHAVWAGPPAPLAWRRLSYRRSR